MFKRLFLDIETSPYQGWFWKPGRKVSLTYGNILKEASIICASFKYEGSDKIYHVTWDNGDDERVVQVMSKAINECDEVIAHNGDRFDIPWIRTRCMKYGIPLTPFIKSIDTLKKARGQFYFPSNRLNDISKYMGRKGKLKTRDDLWQQVVFMNNKSALREMVRYCDQDVVELEATFMEMKPYLKPSSHAGIMLNREIINCPECGGDRTTINKHKVSAAGHKTVVMQCHSCFKFFSVPLSKLESSRQRIIVKSKSTRES
jgi:hypothetical protein